MTQTEIIESIQSLFNADKINSQDKRTVERELLDIQKGHEVHGSTLKWLQSLVNRQGVSFINTETEILKNDLQK